MQFSKWSGCGNDFIIIMESEAENVDAVSMCDRQNGIGADGVVVLKHLKDNDFSMRIINSDRSVNKRGAKTRRLPRHNAYQKNGNWVNSH